MALLSKRLFFYILTKIDLFSLVFKLSQVNQRKQNLKIWGNLSSSFNSEKANFVLTYNWQVSNEEELTRDGAPGRSPMIPDIQSLFCKAKSYDSSALRPFLSFFHCSQRIHRSLFCASLYFPHMFMLWGLILSSERK